jgi:pilus assembly protein CpaE
MPVVVDPDPMVVEALLVSMPAGSHGVESVDRLTAWLGTHSDEYVVVLGPTLTDEEVIVTCEVLRTSAPTISTILAREQLDGELLAAAMRSSAARTSCSWLCGVRQARCT